MVILFGLTGKALRFLWCQYRPDEDTSRASCCVWQRRQDFTGQLIKGGSNVLSHMFNELWKTKREKVLTHATSYRVALSLCDFYFVSKTSKTSASRSSFQLGWEAATHPPPPPHPKTKAALAVTGQRKTQSDEAVTYKGCRRLRAALKCGDDSADVDK